MEYELFNFRHALEVLSPNRAWHELDDVVRNISRDDILAMQATFAAVGRTPKGGQTAINALFHERLIGWVRQPHLFGADPTFREWKMDFLNAGIGVEVSFNHAEAIAWQLTRLTIAGESSSVVPESRIDVGVVITAARSLKSWSRMDGAVGTFDVFSAWLYQMKPILPVPILLLGLKAEGWIPTDLFPGRALGSRGGSMPGAAASQLPIDTDR